MFCRLRGEGRRGWKGRVKNGVRMKHMITLEYIEFSFLSIYNILVIYNYFDYIRLKTKTLELETPLLHLLIIC